MVLGVWKKKKQPKPHEMRASLAKFDFHYILQVLLHFPTPSSHFLPSNSFILSFPSPDISVGHLGWGFDFFHLSQDYWGELFFVFPGFLKRHHMPEGAKIGCGMVSAARARVVVCPETTLFIPCM